MKLTLPEFTSRWSAASSTLTHVVEYVESYSGNPCEVRSIKAVNHTRPDIARVEVIVDANGVGPKERITVLEQANEEIIHIEYNKNDRRLSSTGCLVDNTAELPVHIALKSKGINGCASDTDIKEALVTMLFYNPIPMDVVLASDFEFVCGYLADRPACPGEYQKNIDKAQEWLNTTKNLAPSRNMLNAAVSTAKRLRRTHGRASLDRADVYDLVQKTFRRLVGPGMKALTADAVLVHDSNRIVRRLNQATTLHEFHKLFNKSFSDTHNPLTLISLKHGQAQGGKMKSFIKCCDYAAWESTLVTKDEIALTDEDQLNDRISNYRNEIRQLCGDLNITYNGSLGRPTRPTYKAWVLKTTIGVLQAAKTNTDFFTEATSYALGIHPQAPTVFILNGHTGTCTVNELSYSRNSTYQLSKVTLEDSDTNSATNFYFTMWLDNREVNVHMSVRFNGHETPTVEVTRIKE